MITIHIDPIETNPIEREEIIEQKQDQKRKHLRYSIGIALVLVAIIISLISACSTDGMPSSYQFQELIKFVDSREAACLITSPKY